MMLRRSGSGGSGSPSSSRLQRGRCQSRQAGQGAAWCASPARPATAVLASSCTELRRSCPHPCTIQYTIQVREASRAMKPAARAGAASQLGGPCRAEAAGWQRQLPSLAQCSTHLRAARPAPRPGTWRGPCGSAPGPRLAGQSLHGSPQHDGHRAAAGASGTGGGSGAMPTAAADLRPCPPSA